MAFRITPMSIITTSRHCLTFHHCAGLIKPRLFSPEIPKRLNSFQLFYTNHNPNLCTKASHQITPLVDTYAAQTQSQNVVEILEERGLIETMTHQDLRSACSNPNSKALKVYCGFDPTAESLHLGNLLGIIVLTWFQKCGHVPVALVGGATARVGDPSGKSIERPVLDEETIRRNSDGIRVILERILGHENQNLVSGNRRSLVMNNYDWWKEFKVLDFLRDVGKYARVGTMMAKESVKKRLNSEEGMSFTEFSYQLLQGYDFLHLFKNEGVSVQIGGSDQWGNITAGTDLIRKVLQQEGAYGLTFPLLLKNDGTKFGKSEEGAIWLSPSMLSPYKFYQHFIGTADADVIVFLKKLTFLTMEEILNLEESMRKPGYVPNTLQRMLAEEVTRFVHGEEGLQEARKATEALAPGSKTRLDWRTIEAISNDVPLLSLSYSEVLNSSLVDLSVKGGLLETKAAVKRLIRQGGFYLNNERVESEGKIIEQADIVDDKMLLLSAGKKNKMVVKIA
ncbi:tyrosine--tRNA ligase, chloroplastic/mitochondrial [Cryptomeria japonica]|uniref:tyrosine--tRNA ligase, chloroplastic/mitochondrial n=1 Tax=Cryptomeria japonica TaxID=3369 RepID=UPI0027D9F214|nr:tyrosine--tRNA ligase, chloroplastic/mitochondrial [Cryptomeria japonica]